jgi:hypothetical protein
MVKDIVQTALCSFDNAEFTSLASCPACGGPVQGYDTRQKRYAAIRENGRERTITVKVKRFVCRNCNTLCNANEPFYPGSRTGSLVVDLFFTLSSTMPASRAARVIDTMDIVVDRTTWRNYSRNDYPEIPVTDVFGVHLPLSVVSLSTLAINGPEKEGNKEAEMLAACGFPSVCSRGEKIEDKKQKLQSGLSMAKGESA